MRLWVRNLMIVSLLVLPILVVSLSYLEDFAEMGVEGTAAAICFVADA
jgi:hypothetical protein